MTGVAGSVLGESYCCLSTWSWPKTDFSKGGTVHRAADRRCCCQRPPSLTPFTPANNSCRGVVSRRWSDSSRVLCGLRMTDRKQLDFPVCKKHKSITAH